MMRAQTVLISGAGIAGTALGYWLLRHGMEPTLVERAPCFRQGGYMIDFWGLGYELAERMGILSRLKSEGYFITEVRLVDQFGVRITGIDQAAIRSVLKDRYLSILRGDLANEIYRTLADRAEFVYGDGITSIEQSADSVRATFARARPRRFDLLIGADGLHSAVRHLAFGSLKKYLGYYAASFSVRDYVHRDENAYICYSIPGKQIARYALRGNRSVFLFVWAADAELGIPEHDPAIQKEHLRKEFGGVGWESDAILEAMDFSDDFYFDPVCQVRTDRWSSGRVALIGDAAFCPSLLAGEGASLAMAAAYLLAGELQNADGTPGVAFQEYERKFRPFIEEKQRSAERLARWFAPKSRFGIHVRNLAIRLTSSPRLAKWALGRIISDRFDLPDY
jgi:2-polyprenyl-6-methoxyphenol hydroxylase-like FAD-dependent oxidoreductase